MTANTNLDQLSKDSVRTILRLKEDPSFEPLAGDASDRSYYRVRIADRSRAGCVLMKMKKGFNSPAEEITKTTRRIDELPFLNVHRFLKSAGCPVPEIFGSDPAAGIIMLEDLGDLSLYSRFPSLARKELLKTYKGLVDVMLKFQKAKEKTEDCVAFHRRYDREMTFWELEHFFEWGLESFLGIKIDEEEAKSIRGVFDIVVSSFLACPFVFSHRDYHSKNVMLTGGSFKIIDFQDALLAPSGYDLASLLKDSYVDLEDDLIEDLIEHYYLGYYTKGSKGPQRKAFKKSFDMVSIHRNLKAAGRFVFIERKKANRAYITHIPRTLGYVVRNLERYGEFGRGAEVLLRYIDRIVEKVKRDYTEANG